jgi:hypothetical protein
MPVWTEADLLHSGKKGGSLCLRRFTAEESMELRDFLYP